MYVRDVVSLSLVAPLLANSSISSLRMISMFALTFRMVILCLVHNISCIMAPITNLSRWLCCDNGCHTWSLMRYILLRLSVKM